MISSGYKNVKAACYAIAIENQVVAKRGLKVSQTQFQLDGKHYIVILMPDNQYLAYFNKLDDYGNQASFYQLDPEVTAMINAYSL